MALLCLSSGCATQHANLKDISTVSSVTHETTDPNGTITTVTTNSETRAITTDLGGTAFFSSQQSLEKFKALQTDKTQSVGAGAVNQQGATNVVQALKEVKEIMVEIEKIKSPLPIAIPPLSDLKGLISNPNKTTTTAQ